MIGGEVMVASAGGDDDGRATFFMLSGRVEGERWDVFGRVTEGAGRGFVPEAEGVQFGGGVDDGISGGGGRLRLCSLRPGI